MQNQLISDAAVKSSPMLLPTLTSIMKVELIVSKDDKVWILHDREFSGILHWIEYDAVFRTITMVMRDGFSQDLGVIINDKIEPHLVDGTMVYTILTDGNKIKDMYIVPFVVRK